MALTTTTVCLPAATRPATMAAVRLMAVGSSTEVPPNFITTRLMRCLFRPQAFLGAGCDFGNDLQLAETSQQFRVQNGGAGSSANGVVGKHSELPVEQSAGAQA